MMTKSERIYLIESAREALYESEYGEWDRSCTMRSWEDWWARPCSLRTIHDKLSELLDELKNEEIENA